MRGQEAGLAIAFVGVALVIGRPRHQAGTLGLLMVLGAALAVAAGNVLARKNGPMNQFGLNSAVATVSAPLLFLMSPATESNLPHAAAAASWHAWAALLYARADPASNPSSPFRPRAPDTGFLTLGLDAGAMLDFQILEDNTITARLVKPDARRIRGLLRSPHAAPLTVEQMDEAVSKQLREGHAAVRAGRKATGR